MRLVPTARGIALALYEWRAAPPDAPGLLVGHANGFSAGCYAPILRRLQHRFRLFAFDARGHGVSSVPPSEPAENYRFIDLADDLGPLIAAVRARLGPARPLHYCGHSLGAIMALLHLGRHRLGPFRTLTLFDPPVYPPEGHPLRAAALASLAPLFGRTAKRRVDWPSREVFHAAMARPQAFGRFHPEMLEAYVAGVLRPAAAGFTLACPPAVEASIYVACPPSKAAEAALQVAAPVHLYGPDPGGPEAATWQARHSPDLAARMPNARHCFLPGRGHLMAQEDPDGTAKAVLTHVFGQAA
ncbi:MAG: alpha/beta fold hydrolase [Alphaproteobacteria bacterium]|nr:alpha/beta fold hydrolase [Alphaproteobacteria bacterium]